jgi:hypothetical protein
MRRSVDVAVQELLVARESYKSIKGDSLDWDGGELNMLQ